MITSENISYNEDFGEFLGIFAGDGYANLDNNYHYQVRIFINIKDSNYIDYVYQLMTELFDKKPHKFILKDSSVVVLRYSSKEIYEIVMNNFSWIPSGNGSKSRTVRFMKTINSNDFKIGFIRGCLDSDGYVNKEKIEFATASPHLSDTIRGYLRDIGMHHTYYLRIDKRPNRAPIHIINVNKTNRKRFFDLIKPKNAPTGT